MKCLSLFTGIGGFDLALKQAGHEIVGACEIDQWARRVYAKHFPGVPIWEDATKIKPEELPDIDIICAGFPCQTFSIAGNRLGFEESRGTLFFEIARIAKQKRPRLLLLENVKGLLNHDGGKTFAVILSTLDELGYDAQWQVLNSKYFVPQNRERIFIIGHLRGQTRPEVFPIKLGSGSSSEPRQKTQGDGEWLQDQCSGTIDAHYYKGTGTRTHIGEPALKHVGNVDKKGHNSQWGRVFDPDGIAPTLNAEAGGLGAKTGLYQVKDEYFDPKPYEDKKKTLIAWSRSKRASGKVEERTKSHEAHTLATGEGCRSQASANFVAMTEQRTEEAKAIRKENMKKGRDYVPRRDKELVPREDDLANCVTTGPSMEKLLTNGTRIRRLTPLECERLQGFPDNYTKTTYDGEEVSDTQRYKMCGNAVTVNVIAFILEYLK